MKPIYFVSGQAGTGKTTWLMDKALELAPDYITAEHHSLLAITRMHGARRRVQMKLRDSSASFSFSVSTIDGFALSILNRWRRSLGYKLPIQAVNGESDFIETLFGTEASFERILQKATLLLKSQTIQNILSESFPLILIDEFQDCHGSLLEFAKALSECSTLILAADDFQILDSSIQGCPGIAWINEIQSQVSTQCTELTECHRTSIQQILEAARCLRDNAPSSTKTIPVVCCPDYGPAAFKILQALVYNPSQWQGTIALISPSHDKFIAQVLGSLNNQLQKKNMQPINWYYEVSTIHEQQNIRDNLGITDSETSQDEYWTVPSSNLNPIEQKIVQKTQIYARLKGIEAIPHQLVSRHVDSIIHEKRAYSVYSPKRIVTTVHGAKNREFDNTIVLWPYRVVSDHDLQRRLLYNAITRSKNNCMILVRGDVNRANTDPVLSLLGPAEPAFASKKIKTCLS